MWDEYRDLTPEERLDKIVEILSAGVLRIIEEKKNRRASRRRSPTEKPRQERVKTGHKDLPESP